MESSASASAENADSPANARPKRSRTGCITCRNRRRKCDEGKPICQNCVSKGFECRYAAAFQILGKHNFTPEVQTDVQYANVRFASDNGGEQISDIANQPAKATVRRQSDYSAQTQPIVLPDRLARAELISTNNPSYSGHTPSPNSYEFALHGLLALGSTPAAIRVADLSQTSAVGDEYAVSTFDFAEDASTDSNLHRSSIKRRPEQHRTDTGQSSILDFQMTSGGTRGPSTGLSNFEVSVGFNQLHGDNLNSLLPAGTHPDRAAPAVDSIELLKCYRYNIAPWLDICDANQQFGVALLTESRRTPILRASIVQLAEASSRKSWDRVVDESTPDGVLHGTGATDTTEDLVAGVLTLLADVISDLAASWLSADKVESRSYLLETLSLELGSSDLKTCAYWLLVRLELSRALMAGNNRISLPSPAARSRNGGTNDTIAQYAYDAIALCVDSVMFAQGDDDRWLQRRYGLNRVEVWKTLVQSFAHWYMHRAQAFQPIIELYCKDGVLTDDDFPTIVFTSGGALDLRTNQVSTRPRCQHCGMHTAFVALRFRMTDQAGGIPLLLLLLSSQVGLPHMRANTTQ